LLQDMIDNRRTKRLISSGFRRELTTPHVRQDRFTGSWTARTPEHFGRPLRFEPYLK
jgi:hypothetical protein